MYIPYSLGMPFFENLHDFDVGLDVIYEDTKALGQPSRNAFLHQVLMQLGEEGVVFGLS